MPQLLGHSGVKIRSEVIGLRHGVYASGNSWKRDQNNSSSPPRGVTGTAIGGASATAVERALPS
ncbi:hypothetical protein SPMU_14390 [Sphingomonas mucosissima]|uniref:Uncharacterized protein n=1 Tax=Sphingomonas mucosissima TaxID=370959 RepID=A0A245ZTM4_9SPHN|nr:hypothetical protein SPMU_14390 [Sphingomonas mucosissima]